MKFKAVLGLSLLGLLVGIWILAAGPALAGGKVGLSKGQLVYVPSFAYVYHGVKRDYSLASTLVIRNTDPEKTIKIVSVDYHGPDGKLLCRHLKKALTLAPLASLRFIIAKGGDIEPKTSGATSFMVKWTANSRATMPRIEAIAIGSTSSQGISFVSGGQVVKELP